MKLIWNTYEEGFYVCEDPDYGTIPIDVRIGRGSTLEAAKQDYFKKCQEYADKLRAKATDIHIATQNSIDHEMRHEE